MEEGQSSTPSSKVESLPACPDKPHLQPKGLVFNTPQSGKGSHAGSITDTPGTPATPLQSSERISDVDSLSSENTSVTPEMQNLSIGKRRGRPRKKLVEPNMDDFPFGASEAEQRKYIRKKNTERWRYNKLMGAEAASYRQSELKRVNTYNENKKKTMKEESESSQETDSERQKKLSRDR